MPTLRPTKPKLMLFAFFQRCRLQLAGCSNRDRSMPVTPLQLDLYVHSRREVQLHQRVHRLVGGIDDVHQPQVGAHLELLARLLVDVRRAQQVEALPARRQRHRALHHRAGALGGVDDLQRRLVDQAVVERLQPDADLLTFYRCHVGRVPGSASYSMIFATTPAPTVLPPSRMAKRSPSSIAIGWISATVIDTLSPGITISAPLASSIEPVTSVVRK